ncbi:MAG: 4'-phosphopantetheinyl transferase superfamily protein [Desulfosarcina sp.]|nr:4'-phosphopantetheinyl transferase superfamily protein [Desulfobacterales bacterium]
MPLNDAIIEIDWDQVPACGLSQTKSRLAIGFVPLQAFLQHYLPALPTEDLRQARPRAVAAEDFSRPLLAPMELARVNAFKSLKRQIEWMAGRLAAKTLARSLGASGDDITAIRIAYRPEGAPYLDRRPDLSLSISHAHDYAVAGLSRDADTILGLDLEKQQPLDIELMLRTAFSDRERRRLDPADRDRFFECWTLKEAYLKYLGKGFRESLKQIEILDNFGLYHHGQPVPRVAVQILKPFPAYTLSIVSGPQPTSL